MKINVTKKEFETLIEYQRFKKHNSPCIKCKRKAPLCMNECSEYYWYSGKLLKYLPRPELMANKDLMKYIELLVDVECIEEDIKRLANEKHQNNLKIEQLANIIEVVQQEDKQ